MQTNLVLEVRYWGSMAPSVRTELIVESPIKAEEIAQKLNDISEAKNEENTVYYVQSTQLPPVHKKKAEVDDDDIPF
jgi:reverse gyrase